MYVYSSIAIEFKLGIFDLFSKVESQYLLYALKYVALELIRFKVESKLFC